ncbi:MAG: hypothetical protein HY865_04910, partial [Chloroflexi bacterium]|nr:hypothetical protein [Chloroflexota bacterium]
MRKLIVSEFITLDGVIQAPGDSKEDTDAGFAHGGWTHPYWHDDIGAHFFQAMNESDALLLGRITWQALGQCAGYLRSHGIKAEQVYDTAGSVKMLKESGAHDVAAIASKRAAKLYGMQILEEGVEDNTENYTRFLVIQRELIIPAGDAKTSIVFTLKNVPG